MNFIFPQNYDFSSKLFGFIDYSTAIMDLLIFGFNILIGHLLFNDITFQIIFFVIFCFPIFILSVVGFNHEKLTYVLRYLIKYFCNVRLYLFYKG